MGKPTQERLRNHTFTLMNWTNEEVEHLRRAAEDYYSYMIASAEICPTTGTPHLQCYGEFANDKQYSRRTIYKFMPKRIADIERRYEKALPKETAGYCKKGTLDKVKDKPEEGWIALFDKPHETAEILIEHGKINSPGARADLDKLKDEIASGEKTVDDIVMEQPMAYHQYGRTLDRIEEITMRKRWRTKMTRAIFAWGDGGLGKSRVWYKNWNPEIMHKWNYNNNSRFQDNYIGQPIVVFNEYKGQLPFGELMDVIDEGPAFVEHKSKKGMLPFLAKLAYFTASKSPEELYKNSLNAEQQENWIQWTRRFEVIHITSREQAEMLQLRLKAYIEDL